MTYCCVICKKEFQKFQHYERHTLRGQSQTSQMNPCRPTGLNVDYEDVEKLRKKSIKKVKERRTLLNKKKIKRKENLQKKIHDKTDGEQIQNLAKSQFFTNKRKFAMMNGYSLTPQEMNECFENVNLGTDLYQHAYIFNLEDELQTFLQYFDKEHDECVSLFFQKIFLNPTLPANMTFLRDTASSKYGTLYYHFIDQQFYKLDNIFVINAALGIIRDLLLRSITDIKQIAKDGRFTLTPRQIKNMNLISSIEFKGDRKINRSIIYYWNKIDNRKNVLNVWKKLGFEKVCLSKLTRHKTIHEIDTDRTWIRLNL